MWWEHYLFLKHALKLSNVVGTLSILGTLCNIFEIIFSNHVLLFEIYILQTSIMSVTFMAGFKEKNMTQLHFAVV